MFKIGDLVICSTNYNKYSLTNCFNVCKVLAIERHRVDDLLIELFKPIKEHLVETDKNIIVNRNIDDKKGQSYWVRSENFLLYNKRKTHLPRWF